jgi:hypothetical protein
MLTVKQEIVFQYHSESFLKSTEERGLTYISLFIQYGQATLSL